MKTTQRKKLGQLESEIANLRKQIGISARGETIFHASRSMWSATDVVVEANGEGGARLLIVEGNYPADYLTHKEQFFLTEDDACEVADRIVARQKD